MIRKPYVPTGKRAEAPRLVDKPEPGNFLIRLTRGGIKVPAVIKFVDGEWQAIINGEPQGEPNADPAKAVGVLKVWMFGERVNAQEVEFRDRLREYAVKHDPDHPAAQPHRPIDLTKMKPVF